MARAAESGATRLSIGLGSVASSSTTTGSSSMPRVIMLVSTMEKYAVSTLTPWSASSTLRARPSCSTAALLIAYGMAPIPLRKANTELTSTIWPRCAMTGSSVVATVFTTPMTLASIVLAKALAGVVRIVAARASRPALAMVTSIRPWRSSV